MKYLRLFFLLLLMQTSSVSAVSWPFCFLNGPHRLYLGPEVYYVKRTKEGGSRQTGWLAGGRAEYERRVHGGLYYAIEGGYANGCLEGKSASGRTLKSDLTDKELEGRLGYAFCFPTCKKLTLLPYAGYGYFQAKNDFKSPSPIVYTCRDWFYYGAAGIEISVKPCPSWEWGVDFKAKFVNEGKSRIEDDPEDDNLTLRFNSEIQYEVYLPIRHYGCWGKRPLALEFAPFYRLRHFGGMANFPYDYIETKFYNYGAKLLLNILF